MDNTIGAKDREILQSLGMRVAAIAKEAVNRERAQLWGRLNQLQKVRPLLWITETPWHEMNINDELTLRTTQPWSRQIEVELRRTIYQWKYMQGDMIVSDYLASPLFIRDSGFGIEEEVDIVKTDEASAVVSRHFHRQIVEPEDIEKIKMPVISVDEPATAENYARMVDIFGSIVPIRKVGVKHIWFTPWDHLIRLWGVQEAMMEMVARPEMVHAIVGRFVDASLCRLEQFEKLNLLAINNDNTRIGSGGYGYTSELPGPGFDPQRPLPHNMWGCSNAQIFSGISPQMHWEFALQHEMRWLSRWGLTYYGCCEPLDLKIEILQRIKNLRKISMSPWINIERAVRLVGDKYVFSYKPNPAIFAEGTWNLNQVRDELRSFLSVSADCHVEIIMKDISTVQYQPQRLWEWAKMANELVNEVRK